MLGQALAVVLGVAGEERRRRIVRRVPVVPFGVPSFWPYVPDVPPYHNAAVWPQVVAFHAWAAAEAGNAAAVEHALAGLVRAAGLFLTDKENWVAATGHFEGTEVNSDRFGASAAAQLAIVYRVLFGIRLHADRLELRPFVPRPYRGTRTLDGLRYRGATLSVTVHGFGDAPREVRLDGRPVPRAEVPAALTGAHVLEITLNGAIRAGGIELVDNVATPATPAARREGELLRWEPVEGAVRYQVVRNGEPLLVTAETAARAVETAGVAEYQVRAVDARGLASFLGEPVRVGPAAATWIAEPPPSALDGAGHAHLGAGLDSRLDVAISIESAGCHAVEARYANGSGPISYGDKAAARALEVDGRPAGTLLMPQRGIGRWDDWGTTNAVRVWLEAGRHTLTLADRPALRNMSGATGEALLDHLRITRLAPGATPRPPCPRASPATSPARSAPRACR
jgi:hypothetical protein